MNQQLSQSRVANVGAHAIFDAFDGYHSRFREITRLAQARFEHRDWQGRRADAAARLDLYRQVVDLTLREIRDLLGDRLADKLVWTGMKAVYSGLIADREDWELAETFFNSITRRIFTTVGVDAAIEFVDTDFDTPPTPPQTPAYRVYPHPASSLALIREILADYRHAVPYQDEERDAALVAAELDKHLAANGAGPDVERVEVLRPVFYRNKGAYLIGRMWSGGRCAPLALALLNHGPGIVVDAVLLTEDDLSIVFSFAHSYFHVETARPHDLVTFLTSVMPLKREAELYISLGHHKHGKTELYRDLLRSLATTDERFEIAPGERGMVMEVFTLPGYDLVLKIIRDSFAEPKRTTRQAVMRQYHLVFRHDRAGRLVDAQEFEHLEFALDRFAPALVEELLETAAQTVGVADGRVIIKHAYIERRVTPLDIYLREADEEAARAAALDFGIAIKDLAASNIFPGDFWLKNFGVTRHGRVVSYDYDELCLLTDCRFGKLPQPQDELEALAGEPWFHVPEDQVFPEEFETYLVLPRNLTALFRQHHSDIFEVEYWERMQRHLRDGDVVDIFPYAQERRLRASVEDRRDGQA